MVSQFCIRVLTIASSRLSERMALDEARCLHGPAPLYLDLAVIPPNEQLNRSWHGAVISPCHRRGLALNKNNIRTRWDEAWNSATPTCFSPGFESTRRTRADARLTQDKVDVALEAGEKNQNNKVWPRRRDRRHPHPLLSGSRAIRSVGICGDETL